MPDVKQEVKKSSSKATSDRPRGQQYTDATFINFELDKAQAAACKAWDLPAEVLLNCIDKLCDGTYRLSVKWDEKSHSYAAFLQSTDNFHLNAGYILSGRGSLASKAIKQLLYKHFEIMGEVWKDWAGARWDSPLDD